MKKTKLKYSEVGDNYLSKDPIKKLAQNAARSTSINLRKHGFSEISGTRGESAFVWKQGDNYLAAVIEGLGTKNLVADAMYLQSGKSYYDVIAYDTVATIINDLVTVGATPLVVHAYWAIENNNWLEDQKRMHDFISGWKQACDDAGAAWGGGETPTLKGIIVPGTVELGGSAVGIIREPKFLVTDKNLKNGDAIIMLRSSGINANGLSLARAVAAKMPQGFATKLSDGLSFGKAILAKTHIYANLVQALQRSKVNLHYISNITGHGFQKIMRAKPAFTYIIERVVEPQALFPLIQKIAHLTDRDMYQTFNMGLDYALYISPKDIQRTLKIAKALGFEAIVAGHVEKGPKRVIIKPKNIIYESASFDLRS